jgi:hypothetical protein
MPHKKPLLSPANRSLDTWSLSRWSLDTWAVILSLGLALLVRSGALKSISW